MAQRKKKFSLADVSKKNYIILWLQLQEQMPVVDFAEDIYVAFIIVR